MKSNKYINEINQINTEVMQQQATGHAKDQKG